jgi:hypothetical protein
MFAMVVAACGKGNTGAHVDASPTVGKTTQAKKSTMSNTIRVSGVLVSFTPNAMTDNSDEGFASYDATKVRVVAPPELAGRELTIFHNGESLKGASGAQWVAESAFFLRRTA